MKEILDMIAEELAHPESVIALVGQDPTESLDLGSSVADFRLRCPDAPHYDEVRPKSGTFRISDLPAAPPA